VFICLFGCSVVFSATFNNISAISWRSVLLVEETGGPGENYRPAASHCQALSHNAVHLGLIEIRTLFVLEILFNTKTIIVKLIIILRVSFCSDIWYCNILAYYLGNILAYYLDN
jgi:hypothetical protein